MHMKKTLCCHDPLPYGFFNIHMRLVLQWPDACRGHAPTMWSEGAGPGAQAAEGSEPLVLTRFICFRQSHLTTVRRQFIFLSMNASPALLHNLAPSVTGAGVAAAGRRQAS